MLTILYIHLFFIIVHVINILTWVRILGRWHGGLAEMKHAIKTLKVKRVQCHVWSSDYKTSYRQLLKEWIKSLREYKKSIRRGIKVAIFIIALCLFLLYNSFSVIDSQFRLVVKYHEVKDVRRNAR